MSPCTHYEHDRKEGKSQPQTDNRLDQCALSGAVGTEKNVCLSRIDAQIDSLEHFLAGNFDMKINNFQNRLYN